MFSAEWFQQLGSAIEGPYQITILQFSLILPLRKLTKICSKPEESLFGPLQFTLEIMKNKVHDIKRKLLYSVLLTSVMGVSRFSAETIAVTSLMLQLKATRLRPLSTAYQAKIIL